MIIGISGKIGSGKDLTGKIIQYLVSKSQVESGSLRHLDMEPNDTVKWTIDNYINCSTWSIHKFADKLKECASLILGIPREDLEKIEVKNRQLPEEWNYAKILSEQTFPQSKRFTTHKECADEARRLRNVVAGSDYTATTFNMTVRDMLQQFGTDACRNIIHPNFWVNALFSEYKQTAPNETIISKLSDGNNDDFRTGKFPTYPNWIITDTRFPNELEAIKSREGITIRCNRYLKTQTHLIKPRRGGLVGLTDLHPSETALDNATFDYQLDNNDSIEELIVKVKEILIKERII